MSQIVIAEVFFPANQSCIILAAPEWLFAIDYVTNLSEPMRNDYQIMGMEQLVDILAQKTQRFTQLLVYKDFGTEYKECKDAIQLILAEIELRKESLAADPHAAHQITTSS